MFTFMQNLLTHKSNASEAAKLLVYCLNIKITVTTLSV